MCIINDKIKIRYIVCVTTIAKHSQSMKYLQLILLMLSVVTNVKSVPLKLPAFDRYIWWIKVKLSPSLLHHAYVREQS